MSNLIPLDYKVFGCTIYQLDEGVIIENDEAQVFSMVKDLKLTGTEEEDRSVLMLIVCDKLLAAQKHQSDIVSVAKGCLLRINKLLNDGV